MKPVLLPTICATLLLAALSIAPVAADEPAEAAPLPVIAQDALLEALSEADADVIVLDVRSAREFAAGHVPGARNVPHDELPSKLAELAPMRDKQVVLYCRSGRRTQIAARALREAGFTRLLHLQGDFQAWERAQRPVERADAGPSN